MNLVERFISKESGQILDVGCGNVNVPGLQYCYWRLKAKYDVIGVDIRPGHYDNVLQASGTHLPFDSRSFKYVVSFDVIEHIRNFSAVIKEMLRVVKHRAIIIVPSTSRPLVRNALNWVRRMLGGAGSDLGELVLQGHYYEFFPHEILYFKGDAFKAFHLTLDYPIYGRNLLRRAGIIFAGLYIFDRL
ncbi:MAG: class I SAM-dependent methyltransferase [Candidatus Thorarchaeota archaeon]